MESIKEQPSKLVPTYSNWIWSLIFAVLVFIFWLWLVVWGLNYEKEFLFDLTGYLIVVVAGTMALWDAYELWILFAFLRTETGRIIYFDKSEGTFIIYSDGVAEMLSIRDIREVIFSNRRFGSRTPTASLSYSQLNFKSREPLLITSLVMDADELVKLLKGANFKRTDRDRGLFEGIRIR